MRHYTQDWNELAEREPYFAVLTDPRYLSRSFDHDARQRFFASGEKDIADLLALTARHFKSGVAPAAALDFGCGVGRLTIPLARRVARVTGCDASPAMLELATQNAESAAVANTQFVSNLGDLRGQKFDLISSLLVFQHIPVREGLSTLSGLLQLLAPSGVAALHFTLRRPGSPMRRIARRMRGRIPLLHQVAGRFRGERLELPYIQMNEYDESEIQRRIVAATGVPALVVPRQDGDIEGAVFVIVQPRRS